MYDFAICNRSRLNFLTYEENSILFSFSSLRVNDKTIANVADKLV
jgi:hypothetical protein